MPFLACLLFLIFSDFCCVLGIFSIYKSTLSKWCFYGFAEAVGGIRVFWWVGGGFLVEGVLPCFGVSWGGRWDAFCLGEGGACRASSCFFGCFGFDAAGCYHLFLRTRPHFC